MSLDGGKTWSSPYISQIPSCGFTYVVDGKLYLLEKANAGGYGNLGGEIVDLSQNQMKFLERFKVNAPGGYSEFWFHVFDMNALGKIFIAAKAKYSSTPNNILIFDSSDPDSIIDIGAEPNSFSVYCIKAARKSNTAFLFTDSSIFRRNENTPNWEKAGKGNSQFYSASPKCVDVCGDYGDTIYLVNEYSNFFRCTDARIAPVVFSIFSITQPQVKFIKMINSRAGWVINANGEVYYTKNGLSTLEKEIFKDDTQTEVTIDIIQVAADSKTFFAIGGGKLFRY